MTASPYQWDQHEPGCRCTDCRKVVPLHKPKPAIPPDVKAELARLKALWRSQRAPRHEGDPAPVGEAERVRQRALERKYREAP